MNFHTRLVTTAPPDIVFDALTTKIDSWWGKTKGEASSLDGEFTVHFGKAFWKFRLSDFIHNQRIVWKCIEGKPEFESEWVGTAILWNIKSENNDTVVEFEHDGLTPDFHCYDICAPTWEKFISTSLKKFLETGIGNPHLD